jgi:hypothetical protein
MLLLLSIPFMVPGQTPVAEVAAGTEWWVTVITLAMPLIGSALVWIYSRYRADMRKLIIEKTGNEFLASVADHVMRLVLHAWQTEARLIKGTAAWDDKAKQELKDRVRGYAKLALDPGKLEDAAGELTVDELLDQSIEAAVVKAKTIGKAAKAGAPANPTAG